MVELADCIAVMNDGQIIDAGPHSDLLRRCGLFGWLLQCHSSTRLNA